MNSSDDRISDYSKKFSLLSTLQVPSVKVPTFSFAFEETPFKGALQQVADRGRMKLLFNHSLLLNERTVSMRLEDVNLRQAFEQVLAGTHLDFMVADNGYVIIIPKIETKKIQQETVTGTVTDAGTGETLPGVNVVVKGTTTGTATDADGRYELTVHSLQDTLVFSFIGFQSREIPINGRTVVNAKMELQTVVGDEVVVIGYGEQQRSDVTGSIASVSVQDLQEVPVTNASQALKGRVAGVRIQQTSTRPGASPQIRIRGIRSLTASNNPLLVVNDVPFEGSINDLNTSTIESIQVLKDASATAVYGSRGANGVILITTKKGHIGPPQITYNAYQGISTVARRYDVFSGPEFIAMRSMTGYPYTPREQANLAAGDYTDWQDLMYKNGIAANHQLNVAGGTEHTRYSFGGGYFNETAVLPGQEFQRYSLNANISQTIGDRITIGLNSSASYSITNGESANFMYPILATTPLSPAFDSTGNYVDIPAIPNETAYNALLVKEDNLWEEERKRIATFNSLYGKLQILDGLEYRINVGVSYRQDKYGSFFASRTPFRNGNANQARVNNGNAFDYTIQNLIHYREAFAQNHEIYFTGLYEVHQAQSSNTDLRATEVLANSLQYFNLGLSNADPTVPAANQGYSKRGLISYMARLNYSYDDRYLITLTGRADGSSVLAEGHKWHYYPAVAVAWNVSNESFLENMDLVSNLKLRLSYGETSNQAVSPYSTLGQLDQNRYNFGDTGAYGYYVSNLPNQNLGWEYTRSYNIGLDFGFLDSRISGSVEVYRQHTYNLLLNQALPPTSGVPGSFLTNVGETQNQGLEIALSTVNFLSADGFNWSTDLNFFLNRNEIVALNEGIEQNIGNGWFVGHPINVIYDYKKVGIWQLTGATEAASYGQEPGEIRVADLNGDGQINEAGDRTILGTLNPDFEFGITNRFYYEGFDLSVVAFGRVGGTLISTMHQPAAGYLNNLNGRRNGLKVDYWTPANPTNAYPVPAGDRGDIPDYGSTLGYFDASFLQIRSINLGYTLPAEWIQKIGGRSVRIYANMKNVATLFSPYMDAGGVSPFPTGRGVQGVNGSIPGRQLTIAANTPPVRTFSIGINITY